MILEKEFLSFLNFLFLINQLSNIYFFFLIVLRIIFGKSVSPKIILSSYENGVQIDLFLSFVINLLHL